MSTENKKTSFESSLKSLDTEECIDIYFYRPVGYRWALLFRKMGVSPNAVTVASIFIGIAAGICFCFKDIGWNLAGMLLLVWANSYDSADGQLARMTGKKSEIGRILDGAAGDFWFISIYLSIIFRLWTGWGIAIFLFALVSGICHSEQAAMADYYRNVHLFFLKGREGSELSNSEKLKIDYLGLKEKNAPFFVRFFQLIYMNYTKNQEKITPFLQKMLLLLKKMYGDKLPDEFRKEFRLRSLPLMKYTNMLSFNLRAIVLFVSLFFSKPWIYFLFETTVLNIMLFYMVSRHERICRFFIEKLEMQEERDV